MNAHELETVYEALAAALDRAGPARSADLLARLVLLLAADAVEREAFERALAAVVAALPADGAPPS